MNDELEQEAKRARLVTPRQAMILLTASEVLRRRDFARAGMTIDHPLQASPMLLEVMAKQDATGRRRPPIEPVQRERSISDDEFPPFATEKRKD